ncbi:hypothetical protein LOZ12_001729 [Ophidiomyces ophidiicola]|uniref:uncharacterized protein n=1 Tax=Ophidiomyces ophidiicola TaxID=1387563 RepID=UPI0020C36FBA|nr:uncharacterized protein LOZ57_005081 [Ophidiomyces ophidiicola]KAI1943368.1 hypothetical protein LOZ57_005081 [Ophidiomyces ophidiicola]KAI1953012.1 hypothetical protein LOZ62_001282 [Ophidiomyces ophidiicola]KAI1962641.1 hypothetical protein LOZ59_001973 [Ophidiomyces ophidiicola]KAI1973530.1 hypothetical protein LOZ56_001797 [Ophidiomyces ophidiicola]KAI2025836.1 hypothetical protein LOZ45_003232 [Ophidiomyces ophidiicola]
MATRRPLHTTLGAASCVPSSFSSIPSFHPISFHQRNIRSTLAHFSSSPKFSVPLSPSEKPAETQSIPHSSSTSSDLFSAVNPLPSTRPAQLELPETSAKSNVLKYAYSQAKAYISFYKTGVKNVYHNYHAAVPIWKKLGFNGYLPTSLPPRALSGTTVFEQLVLQQGVTRAQFQLLRRSAYDVRRMLPFILILIVCGEFTPVIVLALGSRVTPLTCRVPKQLDKDRQKKLQRKNDALRVTASSKQWENPTALPKSIAAAVQHASSTDILRSCAMLGLSKSHRLPTFVPGFMEDLFVNWRYRPRLKRWLEYLAVDDALLREAGGVSDLIPEEVRIAVEERGGVDVGLDAATEDQRVKAMKKWLRKWIEDGEKV